MGALASILNKTTITLKSNSLQIDHQPFDIFPKVFYGKHHLLKLEVKEVVDKNNNILGFIDQKTKYGLFVKLTTGKEELILDSLERETLDFILGQIILTLEL